MGFNLSFKERNLCPNCSKKININLKLKLIKEPMIQCPHCTKELILSESGAFWVTFPIFFLFGYLTAKYSTLSDSVIVIGIVIFVFISHKAIRSLEILLSKLKVAS